MGIAIALHQRLVIIKKSNETPEKSAQTATIYITFADRSTQSIVIIAK
jgi:hypothetical protein